MGFRIATNMQSLSAQRNLSLTRNMQDKSMEKLSAGTRIVRAGDDAAGLAISEKLKAELRSLKQAGRNAQDGVSLVQVAEGGMNEIQNILVRLRELSMQAASDTVGDTERKFIDKEVQNLVSETQRIAQVTKWNSTSLLNGEGGRFDIQVGTHNKPELDRLYYDTANTNVTTGALGIDGMTVVSKGDAQGNLEKIDLAINTVSANRSDLGALQNRMMSTINNINIADENLSAANSRIRDTDIALESSELTKANILAQAGTSMLSQANQNGVLALQLLKG